MPRREDIERFKEVLNSLGSEPEIRAAKSELIEEVAAPEEGLPADINELLGSFGQPLEGEPGAEGLDFESLFGEQNEPSAIEDLDNVPRQRRQKTEQPAEPAAPVAPEELPLDLQADIDQMEVVPADEAMGAAAESPEPTPEIEEPRFEGIELPSLDDLQAEPEAAVGEEFFGEQPSAFEQQETLAGAPQEAPAEAPFEAAFEEPGEATLGAPAEAPFEAPAEALASAAEAPIPAPSPTRPARPAQPVTPAPRRPPSPIEEFPSLESFDLGGTEAAGEPQAFGKQEQEPSAPAEESLSAAGLEGLGGGELGELDMNEFDIPDTAQPPGFGPAAPGPRAGQRAPERKGQPRGPAAGRIAERAREGFRGAARKAAQRIAPIAGRIAPAMGRIAPARGGRLEELEAAGVEAAFGAAGAAIELTPEQFERLKESLGSLPRNLKIVVQDIVAAGKGSAAQLAALVFLLVQGASAREIAALAGRITGKSIRIPAGYEKKTGAAFEAERRTFGYAFRENIFPVLRLFVLSSLAVGLFAFLGYRFVYRPLYAYANYSRGYEHISAERFSLANERFSRAVGVWPRRNWFYRYADAFAGKGQLVLAEEKYDQLLQRYPGDRRGILDYARLESRSLMNYEKADRLLLELLDKNLHDYDALLAAGDNNLEWAERDPTRFEEARRSYAALIQSYGERDALLFRMLRYFIRTNKIDEVERLREYYAERPGVRVDPDAFAELGGYLIDVKRLDYVPDVLFRAMRVRTDLPEIHYALARYYKILKDTTEERKALEKGVLPLLKSSAPLTKKRMTIEIDTHTRLGELFYRQEAYLDAQRELAAAVRLVERYQGTGQIGAERIFGQPYVDLGDLRYYIEGDLKSALANYQKAAANAYADPLLDYKMGYIRYAGGDYEAALGSFLTAEEALAVRPAEAADESLGSPRPPANLLFSIGNAFYQRADYFAAQGYYLRLLDMLTTRKTAIGILQPEQQPEHRALLESLMKADNNLGVVMVRLADRTGDRRKKSQALVSLTSASETADVLSRVPETLVRSEAKNLPFLNMRGVLYPLSGFEPQIYRVIPKDFQALFF